MRAVPPSRRDMLVKWGILVSDVHYVEPPNDRVVTDLTGSGANESSPESVHGYAKERVQCDYVDVVVEEMVRYLDLVSMFSDRELVSIKADIKSAFMRIPIHLDSMGTFAMEWDGWIFIFNGTCFGWKYASHTFSDFTKAIKMKTQAFNRNGWLCSMGQGQGARWFRVAQQLCFHQTVLQA